MSGVIFLQAEFILHYSLIYVWVQAANEGLLILWCCINVRSVALLSPSLQTLMSAPLETHVETEPAPMWWEGSSVHVRKALNQDP